MPPLDPHEAKLRTQAEKWRTKLLDVGNRNPLINCSFNLKSGSLEIIYPDCETVWRKLAADSEAGVSQMRFPWRRDLVPPESPVEEVESLSDEEGKNSTLQSSTSVGRLHLNDESNRRLEPRLKQEQEKEASTEACLASSRLLPSDLLSQLSDKALDRRLRTLEGYARLSMSEQGVHCLYVAFGFLKWFESVDSDKELFSPLMLVPVSLSRSSTDAPWELTEAEDDVIDNQCLRQRLKRDFNLELPLLPEIDELEEAQARGGFLKKVRDAIASNERWTVEDRCTLGRFAFPKIAMWQDFGDHTNYIISSPLCRVIAGDSSVPLELAFGAVDSLPAASKLDDEVQPGEIKSILDCDSSQLEAIVAARRGVSFVLDGPPGTGKSQTIANIIADSLSAGRRVLFVSEKIAALEVVKRRLDERGLGDFCLECHSSKANRKTVLEELRSCLEIPAEKYDDVQPKLDEAKRKRDSLNAYVRSVHRPRPPLGMSPFEVYGRLSRLQRTGANLRSNCPLPDPGTINQAILDRWMQLTGRAGEFTELIRQYDVHPWRGCKLTSRPLSLTDDLYEHFTLLADALEALDELIAPLAEDALLPQQVTCNTLLETLANLQESLKTPEIPSGWFRAPREIAEAVLQRGTALERTCKLNELVADYNDDVIERFPSELVRQITDSQDFSWADRLKQTLPTGIREQYEVFSTLSVNLRNVEQISEVLSTRVNHLIKELAIPFSPNCAVSAIPKLVRIAKVIAKNYPLRPSWLKPENWDSIRQTAAVAIGWLDALEADESLLSSKLQDGGIRLLEEMVWNLSSIQADWTELLPVVPSGTLSDVGELRRQLQRAAELLEAISNSTCRLAEILQIANTFHPNYRTVQAISQKLSGVARCGMYHGGWVSSENRQRIYDLCDEVIANLTEAEELREGLTEKMSHRAFKTSAVELIERSKSFRSLHKRWFGGFSSFKRDMAAFYKTDLPPTKTLLADCERLDLYHSLLSDAKAACGEVNNLLPEGHRKDDLDAWMHLRSALKTFESLLKDLPELAPHLHASTVLLDSVQAESILNCLSQNLSDFDSFLQESLLIGLIDVELSPDSNAASLRQKAKASIRCQETWDRFKEVYSDPPDTFHMLVEDLVIAARCAALRRDLSQHLQNHHSILPVGAISTGTDCWKRLDEGLSAAELLRQVLPKSSAVEEVVCNEGIIDTASLITAAAAVVKSYKQLDTAILETEKTILLSAPQEPPVQIGRRSSDSLGRIARLAAEQFEQRTRELEAIAGFIRADRDVPLDRLSKDNEVIESLRRSREEILLADKILFSQGVDVPEGSLDGGIEAASWILRQSDPENIPELLRIVATDGCIRDRIQHICIESAPIIDSRFQRSWEFLTTTFDLESIGPTSMAIGRTPISKLSTRLRELREQTSSLDDWIKFSRWQRDMTEAGFDTITEELLKNKYDPSQARDCIAARFYRSLYDHFAKEDPLLGEFEIEQHEKLRERFRQLDEWEVKAAATRIREYQLGREDRPRSDWSAPVSSEVGILQRETQKKRRHKPLRRLFAEIPNILQRLKPCIMMSPLSVSTFLQSEDLQFDLVVFDEASQVFPWDAVGAIYRGKQLIVAGDEKQLPPTNFFNRGDIESEDDEDEDIGDFESILSVCKSMGMPNKRLRWHYRSRREPLIVFSNRHFYDGDLVTFPSVCDASGDAVRLELVPDGRWVDRKNCQEASRIADLVIQHLRSRPGTSLGVIAFSASQQNIIEDEIYDRRRTSPEIDALFHSNLRESIFVKNLENVQGDERDVIYLSMGYAFNEAGKFNKNFGPLSKAGGERRLNVAVTRARQEVVFVASVTAAQMDLSGSLSAGAHLLKAYLDYAHRGVDSLAQKASLVFGECDSIFEQEVASELIKRGLKPVPQVGCSGFRIDLALKHPHRPGEFCLGIECDGASYHSSHTARDRDRIRQSVLEDLGWRIVRIWSTDWIRDPSSQVDRILAAYEKSIDSFDLEMHEFEERYDSDEEFDLTPRIVETKDSKTRSYVNIEEVPAHEIGDIALEIMSRVGATDWDDLIKLIARELGFRRTGSKIRWALEEVLNEKVSRGVLRRIGERVALQKSERT